MRRYGPALARRLPQRPATPARDGPPDRPQASQAQYVPQRKVPPAPTPQQPPRPCPRKAPSAAGRRLHAGVAPGPRRAAGMPGSLWPPTGTHRGLSARTAGSDRYSSVASEGDRCAGARDSDPPPLRRVRTGQRRIRRPGRPRATAAVDPAQPRHRGGSPGERDGIPWMQPRNRTNDWRHAARGAPLDEHGLVHGESSPRPPSLPAADPTRSARVSISTLTSLRPGGHNPRRTLRFARGRPADQRGWRGAASTSLSTFSSVTRASSCLRVSSMPS